MPTTLTTAASVRVFMSDDNGQGLVEYALILGFLAIVVVATLQFFGARTHNTLTNSANAVGAAISY